MSDLVIIDNQSLATTKASLADLSLSEQIQAFLLSLDINKNSLATYTRQFKRFVAWLAGTGRAAQLNGLDRVDIVAYRDSLKEAQFSATSISGYMTPVRKFFTWLEANKVYPDIARGVRGAKKPQGFRKDTLSPEQLRETLNGIDTSSTEGLRNYAIFNLMARTGLRAVEVTRAGVGDIRRLDGSPVLYIQGKGRDSKDAFVILTEEALDPIKSYLEARGRVSDSAPLFVSHSDRNRGESLSTRSVSRVIKTALRAVGLDDSKLTAHSLRHTAITLALKGGASIFQAQAMARHSDPKTTMIYARNLERVAEGAERLVTF